MKTMLICMKMKLHAELIFIRKVSHLNSFETEAQENSEMAYYNHYQWLHLILNTCGTHFGDTKLVVSIDKRPVFDSMSINLILVSVGTIAYKQIEPCSYKQ